MSEYYGVRSRPYYERCETLAEFNFYVGDDDDEESIDKEDNYIYCFCSRVFIRDGIKTYFVDNQYVSESDAEVLHESHSQDWEDQSHVHFSLDTSYKVKCERDDGASCYCSASHTDNCCSTDEHDLVHNQAVSHALQPSDSGADLTYQDYHSDTHDKLERMDHDFITTEADENYQSENSWEKFWAVNGERLIWASWIKNYSDYINPSYLGENNELVMDENNIPKQHSFDQIYTKQSDPNADDEIRERKFSYDSKVNPYKKKSTANPNQNQQEKIDKNNDSNNDDPWLPIGRRRSFSEHVRILSPRTLAGTDSMTNVTKLTFSSYDVTSSHVTSDSTPTDDYSVMSSSSDDPSNDQTRIVNIDEKLDYDVEVPSEELDTEQYWQFLWKKHFGEQYALHLAKYTEEHNKLDSEMPDTNIGITCEQPVMEDRVLGNECENCESISHEMAAVFELHNQVDYENSESNSQEMPTIVEIRNQVNNIKLEEKVKPKRRKKSSTRYITSVGVLLQNLIKDETKNVSNDSEPVDAGDNSSKTEDSSTTTPVVDGATDSSNCNKPVTASNINSSSYNDGDDDPPEEQPVWPKKTIHEPAVSQENEKEQSKVKETLELMGFCVHTDKLPKGEVMFRKRMQQLRPPRYKRFSSSKKTYFDEDGNPYSMGAKDSQDERDMQTDDDCTEVISQIDKEEDITNAELTKLPSLDEHENSNVAEAANVPLPDDDDEKETEDYEDKPVTQQVPLKRKRKPKRYSKLQDDVDTSVMPEELRDDPKMYKYWKKRHSLFFRFDEGIKLDRESWFSVTPENVALHIAQKYPHDVVLDAFCGAGGNTIQFALACKKVIAIDIDPHKIELARHNASVYGVSERVEFVVGDFFELAPSLRADMVFLSPPWGGPSYSDNQEYDLETMLGPRPLSELIRVSRTISESISIYLPRNSRTDQLLSMAKELGGYIEIEQSFLDRRFIAITAYYYQQY